ncbi:hypothetical protein [Ramlibacter sp.]|uniref:hypothetical protein n=1 Tax=Ramlibacter sp. TaxID=1917967 RepID=UPI0026176630|nr:hypothetical protein [Ramlibacter sp.]MDB5953495.1 hypothetical protein [Ramlibacter sp.]
MHAAPSVSYPVGRSAFAGRLYALAALAGLAVAGAWCLQSPAMDWRHACALAAVLLACGLAWHGWQASPVGVLRWDGAGWQWQEGADVAAGHTEIALDLQSRLLVRFHAEAGPARWLWVEREAKLADWEALRRAVYSRASARIPGFLQGGKETPPAGKKPPAAEQ